MKRCRTLYEAARPPFALRGLDARSWGPPGLPPEGLYHRHDLFSHALVSALAIDHLHKGTRTFQRVRYSFMYGSRVDVVSSPPAKCWRRTPHPPRVVRCLPALAMLLKVPRSSTKHYGGMLPAAHPPRGLKSHSPGAGQSLMEGIRVHVPHVGDPSHL